MDFLPFTPDSVAVFTLVFIRVITIVALLPVIGSDAVPVMAKVGLSFLLAIILFPIVSLTMPPAGAFSLVGFAVMIFKEMVVGMVLGFTASLIFAAAQFAGDLAAAHLGFSFVETVDPLTDRQTTPFGQLKMLLFTILFLLINGHYFFILSIEKSFEIIPLLGIQYPGGAVAYQMAAISGKIFVIALKLAAPIIISLLITTIAMGIIARTVPQINVFFVGVPVQIGFGMLMTVAALPVIATMFKSIVDGFVRDMWTLLMLLGSA